MFSDSIAPAAWSAVTLLAQEASSPEASPIVSILNNPFTLFGGLFLLFYFIVIMPERRRKAEDGKMKSAIKKNDRVVTIGGIHGTVVAAPADGDVITIRIDENSNTRMKINRTAVGTILKEKESSGDAGKEVAADTKNEK